jgi:hypothetical protein
VACHPKIREGGRYIAHKFESGWELGVLRVLLRLRSRRRPDFCFVVLLKSLMTVVKSVCDGLRD